MSNPFRVVISTSGVGSEVLSSLQRSVFPDIHSICRQRNVRFEPLVLRWIEQTANFSRSVGIRTILNEVESNDTHLIGIIGNDNEIAPTLREIRELPGISKQYPWLEQLSEPGLRLDMILIHHALGQMSKEKSSIRSTGFFYHDSSTPSIIDAISRKEEKRVFQTPYSDGESLCTTLLKYLTDLLDESIPLEASQSLQDRRDSRFKDLHQYLAEDYVPDTQAHEFLDVFAASDDPPLVIYGEPGSGKSALLANWSETYIKEYPDTRLIEYYIGSCGREEDHHDVLDHICNALELEFESPNFITPRLFPSGELIGVLLFYANTVLEFRDERLILLIDGFDALQDSSQELSWIQDRNYSRIRVIVSTNDTDIAERLVDSEWIRYEMSPMSMDRRMEVASKILEPSLAVPDSHTVQRLVFNDSYANPFSLNVLLQTVLQLQRNEELSGYLNEFRSKSESDSIELFLLEQLEQRYTPSLVRSVLSLLVIGKYGLEESVIVGATRTDPLTVKSLLNDIGRVVVEVDGFNIISNAKLRSFISKRYLSDSQASLTVSQHLAQYLMNTIDGDLQHRRELSFFALHELFYQLYRSGNSEQLVRYLTTVPVYMVPELYGLHCVESSYWEVLKPKYDLESLLLTSLTLWNETDYHSEKFILYQTILILNTLGLNEAAQRLNHQLFEAATANNHEVEIASYHSDMGYMFYQQSDYLEAIREFTIARDMNDVMRNTISRNSMRSAIGDCYMDMGDYEKAFEQYPKPHEHPFDDDERILTAQYSCQLGACLMQLKDYDEAKYHLNRAYQYCCELHQFPLLLDVLYQLGELYFLRNELDDAYTKYQEMAFNSLAIDYPYYRIEALKKMAGICTMYDNNEQATEYFSEVELIEERLQREDQS